MARTLSVKVNGSKPGTQHTLTIKPGQRPYCSCPAWRFQRVAAEARECKHTRAIAVEVRWLALG